MPQVSLRGLYSAVADLPCGYTKIVNSLTPWQCCATFSPIPPLELKSSSLGTKKFQEGNKFWNSYVT